MPNPHQKDSLGERIYRLVKTTQQFKDAHNSSRSNGPVHSGAAGIQNGKDYTGYLLDIISQQNDLITILENKIREVEDRLR